MWGGRIARPAAGTHDGSIRPSVLIVDDSQGFRAPARRWGGADNDDLSGGADDDSLRAVGGSDTLSGGDGRDAISYADAPSKVVATIGGTGGPSGEADTIEADVEDLDGSDFDDWLVGSDAANTLTGHLVKDVIVGKGGLDVLKGDEGADALDSDGDGLQDHTVCGPGGDQAKPDKVDLVDADWENVSRV